MRWGKKKPSQNSSRQSFMSHVFPSSWLMKFKHMNINNTSQKHARKTSKEKLDSSAYAAATTASHSITGGRFHGGDSDAFWRLSFGEDSFNARSHECVARRVQREPELSVPNWQSCRLNCGRVAGHGKDERFRNMAGDIRKMKGILRETDGVLQEKVVEIRTPRLIRNNRRKVVKFSDESGDLIEREDCKLPAYDSRINSVDSAENPPTPDWQKLKEQMIEELKLRNDQQRKSMYISRDSAKRRKPKQSVKLRVYSPRTAARLETCRVKALEDMRKAKLKMRRAKEKTIEESSNGFDSFAVVKCSFDPQKDFKDSMNEMIKEKDIRSPEELEDLLACYLTLNADEYHDLIIKVFRQVWFELNQPSPDTKLETESDLL